MNHAQAVTLAIGLSFEIDMKDKGSNMKMSGKVNTLATAQRFGYEGKRRKIDALVWLVEVLLANDIEVPSTAMATLKNHGYELATA